MAPHIDFLTVTPEWDALTAGYDNLIAWPARMNARKNMQVTTWEKVAAMAQEAMMQKASWKVVEDYPVREPGNARILYAAFLSQTISFVMYLELRND